MYIYLLFHTKDVWGQFLAQLTCVLVTFWLTSYRHMKVGAIVHYYIVSMKAWYCLFISKVMCTKGIYSQVSTETLDQYSRSTLNLTPSTPWLTLDGHFIDIYRLLGVGLFSIHAYHLVNTQPSIDCLLIIIVNQVLIEYQSGCWLSIDWGVDQGY